VTANANIFSSLPRLRKNVSACQSIWSHYLTMLIVEVLQKFLDPDPGADGFQNLVSSFSSQWISVTSYFHTSSKDCLLPVSLPPVSCPPCLEYLRHAPWFF